MEWKETHSVLHMQIRLGYYIRVACAASNRSLVWDYVLLKVKKRQNQNMKELSLSSSSSPSPSPSLSQSNGQIQHMIKWMTIASERGFTSTLFLCVCLWFKCFASASRISTEMNNFITFGICSLSWNARDLWMSLWVREQCRQMQRIKPYARARSLSLALKTWLFIAVA